MKSYGLLLSTSLCACLQCHNRVMFKQFLQAAALQFVQIDSCRVGSVNENLAIILMAAKFNGKSNLNIISKSTYLDFCAIQNRMSCFSLQFLCVLMPGVWDCVSLFSTLFYLTTFQCLLV